VPRLSNLLYPTASSRYLLRYRIRAALVMYGIPFFIIRTLLSGVYRHPSDWPIVLSIFAAQAALASIIFALLLHLLSFCWVRSKASGRRQS